MFADQKSVVFLDAASEELEEHDQQDDADTGSGEHACAADVPGRRDEAGVDRVPVPKHLSQQELAP